jgi:hypothetical protein
MFRNSIPKRKDGKEEKKELRKSVDSEVDSCRTKNTRGGCKDKGEI